MGASIACPVCQTVNAPGEKYCGECGFLLSSVPGEAVEAMPSTEQAKLVDPAGQEYYLRPGENSVGRESADILLADPTVSRRHAVVVLDAGKCWVEDCGSTNGTVVNGKSVGSGERVEAADGAEIKFGSAVLTLLTPEASAESVDAADEIPDAVDESSSEEAPVPEEAVAEMPDTSEEAVSEEAAAPEQTSVARLVSPADPSKVFALVEGTNTIGRREGNDIVLSGDSYVSGSHAELIVDERGFWFMDIGSTNGSTLNGAKVAPNSKMALGDGDELVLGQTVLRFEFLTAD